MTTPSLMKCICGKDLRILARDLYHCAACGRSRFGTDGLTPGTIAVVVLLTIVAIIVMGIVGDNGAKYRA